MEVTMEETKAAINKIIDEKLGVIHPSSSGSDDHLIKYKPCQQSAAFNSGAKERLIRIQTTQVDPLEPSKFKRKRIPRGSGSPPVTVMHSPPRPVSVEDIRNWTIPSCVSNWKNPKGYVIPLDKRLAADGRGLQDVVINEKFAVHSEALYVAEQQARKDVALRSKLQQELAAREKENQDKALRALAAKALSEKASFKTAAEDCCYRELNEREELRRERREERKREKRSDEAMTGKKRKTVREKDRDISEKVALGLPSASTKDEYSGYDQRLFNQEQGMNCGFAEEDQYSVYDKGLFAAQATLSTLYQPKKDRLKPADLGETGSSERRSGQPVAFEPETTEDLFGLGKWMTKIKKDSGNV